MNLRNSLDAGDLHTATTRRLLILDTWRHSGSQAADFAVLVGVSKYTLYE